MLLLHCMVVTSYAIPLYALKYKVTSASQSNLKDEDV